MNKVEKLKKERQEVIEREKQLMEEIEGLKQEKANLKNTYKNSNNYSEKGSIKQGLEIIQQDIEKLENEKTNLKAQSSKLYDEIQGARRRARELVNKRLPRIKAYISDAKYRREKQYKEAERLKEAGDHEVKQAINNYNNLLHEIINLGGKEFIPEGYEFANKDI